MYMGVFGSGSVKPHLLFSNDAGLLENIAAVAGSLCQLDRTKCTVQTTRKYIDRNGKRRCVGIPDALRESAYLAFVYICNGFI